jgi:hypothetical protein
MSHISTEDDCDSNCFYQEQTDRKPKGEKDVVFDKSSFRGVKSDAVMINPEAKQAKRSAVEDAVAAFLAKGGKITKCPPGPKPNFRFGQPRAPAGSVGTSRSGDLSRRRWRDPMPSPAEARDLLRLAQAGNNSAYEKLFKGFNPTILKIASEYSGPPHNELYDAGVEGFCYGVRNFNLKSNNGVKAFVAPCIRGKILDAIKEWQKRGIKSDTRADRYLFANPGATAEQIVGAIGGKLKAAEQAIARVGAFVSYDTTEGSYDEDNPARSRPLSSANMSPQLLFAGSSDKTTAAENITWRLAREVARDTAERREREARNNEKNKASWRHLSKAADVDLRRRAAVAARCAQYPECDRSSELWSWHRFSNDIRSAADNKRWQQNDWYLDPNFTDDKDYKPESERKQHHVRESKKAPSRSGTAEDVGGDRESGDPRLHERERFRA